MPTVADELSESVSDLRELSVCSLREIERREHVFERESSTVGDFALCERAPDAVLAEKETAAVRVGAAANVADT